MEKRCKLITPIINSDIKDLNIINNSKNKSNIVKRIFTNVEHNKNINNQVNSISHTLEICFINKLRYRRRYNRIRFRHKHRRETFFITTSKIRIIVIFMVKKSCFTTNRKRRMIFKNLDRWIIRGKLMYIFSTFVF